MPSEPEKPIEKLLRRWSSERRKHAGENWEIHPVNRRILHQEIGRRFGQKASGQAGWFSRILTVPWLKPVGSFALVAALLLAGWFLFSPSPTRHETSLARNQAPAPAVEPVPVQLAFSDKPAGVAQKKEANVAEPKQLLADNAPAVQQLEKTASAPLAAKDRSVQRESLLDQATVPDSSKNAVIPNEQQSSIVAASSPAPAPRLENLQRYGLARGLGGAVGPAPASEPAGIQVSAAAERGLLQQGAAPATLAFRSAVAGAATPSNLIQYGRFVVSQNEDRTQQDSLTVARRAASAPASSTAGRQSQPSSAILSSFQMEQLGPVLRVIDTDSSIYTGTIQSTNLVAAPAAAVPVAAAATDELASAKTKGQVQSGQLGNQYLAAFFRVSGTNRSLNRRVVFSGTLSEMTNLYQAGAMLQGQAGGTAGGISNFASTNQQLQRLQINGTAWIDGQQRLQINAVPAAKE